jgi:hypothetical protein
LASSGSPPKALALGDQSARMVADVEPVQVISRPYPPVESADALSGLGGVFGDVAGNGLVGEVSGRGDRSYVDRTST